MATVLREHQAFEGPGSEPRRTRGDKDGVGTTYSANSRVWFTLWNGPVTEVYYPTIDRPHIRDLQLMMTDGEGTCRSMLPAMCPSHAPMAPDERWRRSMLKITCPRPNMMPPATSTIPGSQRCRLRCGL